MRSITGRAFAILLLVSLTACASRKLTPVDKEEDTPPGVSLFDQGLKALESEDYPKAARIFDKLLVARPANEKDLVTLYNSGAAYEGMGNCLKASERYRELVRSSAGKFPLVEGPALFRLSLTYECLGQDVKSVTALLDARKRGKELSYATLHAEIPARLAASYARLGNRKKATEYFELASKGLKKLVAQEYGAKQRETLGKTLFLMGQLNPGQRRAEGNGFSYLQGISMQQPYLLQSLEMGQKPWSERAASDLNLAFDNIWKVKIGEDESRYEFLTRALQVLRELKRIRMPNPSPDVEAIFAKVDTNESRLQTEMARVAETTKLTPEAENREGLKREGRLVNPLPPVPRTQKTKPRLKR